MRCLRQICRPLWRKPNLEGRNLSSVLCEFFGACHTAKTNFAVGSKRLGLSSLRCINTHAGIKHRADQWEAPLKVSFEAALGPFQSESWIVVEIVAVKALWNNTKPQFSISRLQRIQSKLLIITRFQRDSTSRRIWFGTRGSEVQILSPRPSLESIGYNKSPGAEKYGPRGHF